MTIESLLIGALKGKFVRYDSGEGIVGPIDEVRIVTDEAGTDIFVTFNTGDDRAIISLDDEFDVLEVQ